MIKHDDVLYLVQVGVLPVDDSKVTMKGRLGPGMMISVDLLSGQVCKALMFLFLFIFSVAYFLYKIVAWICL